MCIIPPTIFKLDLICLLSDCALQSRKIICSLKLQFFVGYQISKYSIWQTMLTANHVVKDLCSLEWSSFWFLTLRIQLETLQEHQLARQSSNFGVWPNFQSDAARCETATPQNLNLWPRLQPEHGGNQPACWSAELDLWVFVQPEPGKFEMARGPEIFDPWQNLQPESEESLFPLRSAELDVRSQVQPKSGEGRLSGFVKIGSLRFVAS